MPSHSSGFHCGFYSFYKIVCWKGLSVKTEKAMHILFHSSINSLLLFSHSVVSDSLWPHGLQHTTLPCTTLPCPPESSRVCSNSCPLSQWCHPTISSYVIPSPLAFNLSQHQGLSQWVSSLHQVARELELQLQHQSFQWIFRVDILEDWLVWSPCSPRNSQKASPAPQFKWISSSALSFLYGPTLINSLAVTKSGFPNSSVGKESTCNARDPCLIPGLGRSLQKGKATLCSILAWRIPRTV